MPMFEWNTKTRFDKIDAAIADLQRTAHALMLQNEVILSKLENRPSKLSAADQDKLNQIYATATGSSAKIDAAISPKS